MDGEDEFLRSRKMSAFVYMTSAHLCISSAQDAWNGKQGSADVDWSWNKCISNQGLENHRDLIRAYILRVVP